MISQNLMGSELEKDPSSEFFQRSNQQCLHNPTDKQTNNGNTLIIT